MNDKARGLSVLGWKFQKIEMIQEFLSTKLS
jgi:hypothetical protein